MSVSEVMTEVLQDEWTEDEYLVRWLEAWFMILGTAVDLKY
jgi:ubiquitin-like-conjugating enzyme ATG10